ncbi:MAG TPA: hypothetical protein PKD55_00370 [Bellilinea sp.]|nr:hypothetical protein [Bellilinea sp.]
MSNLDIFRGLNLSDLSSQGAVAMVRRVTETLHRLPDLTPENQKEWTDNLLSLLRMAVGVKKGVTIIEAHTLWLFKKNWDSLDYEFRSRYDMQFDVFAQRETDGLSIDTIENYMRAARVFLEEGYKPDGPVEVPVRDEEGNLITENGRPKMKEVAWDPTQADITKLVLLTSLARTGQLDNERSLLSMAMDSKATVSQMRLALYGAPGADKEPNYDLRFRLEGPMLVVSQNGRSAPVAEFLFDEYETDELVKQGIDRLLSMLSIRKDEQIILAMAQNGEASFTYFED